MKHSQLKQFLALVLAFAVGFVPLPAMASTAGTITISPSVTETVTTDLGDNANWSFGTPWRKQFQNGTGLDQASKVFQDSVTLAGSASQTYDLDGSLTGPLATVSFSRIYAIFIRRTDTPAASTQDENVNLKGDFILTKFLTAGGDTLSAMSIPIRPGGVFVYISPDSTGTAVTASTGDEITLTNASSADSCTLQVLILGN